MEFHLYVQPSPLSWSARSQIKEWSLSIIFSMDAPDRATTGVLDPGLPAAESVDQVRVSDKQRPLRQTRTCSKLFLINLLLVKKWHNRSHPHRRQVTSLARCSAPLTTRPTPTTSVHLCRGHRTTVRATPTRAHRAAGKRQSNFTC